MTSIKHLGEPKYTLKQKWLLFLQEIKRRFQEGGIICVLSPRLYHHFCELKYSIASFFHPWNVVKVKTLPNQWVESDEFMLHVNFQILTDFVDKQWDGGKSEYHGHLIDLRPYEEKVKENPDDKFCQDELKALTEQNKATQEIIDLHAWWTKIRPQREDPHNLIAHSDSELAFKVVSLDDNGLPELYEMVHEHETEEEREKYHDSVMRCFELEQKYRDEDTDMLMRLMKVRSCLWT